MDTQISHHEARRLIDKEIADVTARMQHSVRLLKTRRNELSPAVNIPDEILVEIFLIIMDANNLHAPGEWYPIIHRICRHWRRVAVSSPSLWNHIHFTSHAYTSLMLERSRNAPLEICFTHAPRRGFSNATLTGIFHEIGRIRSLLFAGTVPESLLKPTQAVLLRLGKEATLLEELTVHLSSQNSDYPVFTLDAFRPTRLLRKLCLGGVRYYWNILPVPSLTHLTLLGKETSTNVSGAQFTDALRQMQHLEDLSINLSTIPLRQYKPSTNLQPIHLPCLERLTILNRDGHQEPIETLLSQMTHPRLHELSIDFQETVIHHSTMIRLIGSSIQQGDFRSLEALEINLEEFKIYSLPGAPGRHSLVLVKFGVDVNDSEATRFDIVTDIMSCCITPFDSSPILSLTCASLLNLGVTAEQFIHLFGYLPNLTSIITDNQIPLFHALTPPSTLDDATPEAPKPFPKLQTIRWRPGNILTPHNSKQSATVFRDLYSCLFARKAHGLAISRLHLMVPRSYLSESQIKKLKQVVAFVFFKRDGS